MTFILFLEEDELILHLRLLIVEMPGLLLHLQQVVIELPVQVVVLLTNCGHFFLTTGCQGSLVQFQN